MTPPVLPEIFIVARASCVLYSTWARWTQRIDRLQRSDHGILAVSFRRKGVCGELTMARMPVDDEHGEDAQHDATTIDTMNPSMA